MTNPDLPQFDPQKLSGNWAEVGSAYDLSSFLFSIPVAIQTIRLDGRRALSTGLLTATEDRFAPGAEGEVLVESIFYFKDTPPLTVAWSQVKGVIAMIATEFPQEEQSNASE